jgi:hypothetical protein
MEETFLPCLISQRNALVNRSFGALIVFSHCQVFSSRNTFWFPASELSTHNYTDGSETAFSLSILFSIQDHLLKSLTSNKYWNAPQARLPPVAEYVRVRLPVIAMGKSHNPAPFNSKLSTPPVPPITRSVSEISLGQGTQNSRVLLPEMARGPPDHPTTSNSQPRSPSVPPVPRWTPEISSSRGIIVCPRFPKFPEMATGPPDHPTTSNRQPDSPPVPPAPRSTPEPTLIGIPPEIQAMIWKKTLGEPRIVHIKYCRRQLPPAICPGCDQEVVITYHGG